MSSFLSLTVLLYALTRKQTRKRVATRSKQKHDNSTKSTIHRFRFDGIKFSMSNSYPIVHVLNGCTWYVVSSNDKIRIDGSVMKAHAICSNVNHDTRLSLKWKINKQNCKKRENESGCNTELISIISDWYIDIKSHRQAQIAVGSKWIHIVLHTVCPSTRKVRTNFVTRPLDSRYEAQIFVSRYRIRPANVRAKEYPFCLCELNIKLHRKLCTNQPVRISDGIKKCVLLFFLSFFSFAKEYTYKPIHFRKA